MKYKLSSQTKLFLIGSLLIIIISLPFIVAAKSAGGGRIFGGFLLNPIDGNSYLAKMEEGFSGDWLFTLPYTAGDKNGKFLFEFYLILGHIARILKIPLLTAFHLARIISTILFFYTLITFLEKTSGNLQKHIIPAIILVCFGSGSGWLSAGLGYRTSDLWVAEAFPFLSAFSNPHFILGMGIFLVILTKYAANTGKDLFLLWVSGILLSVIMPFAAGLAGLILFARELWRWFDTKKFSFGPLAAIFWGGGLLTIFQYWQIINDPLLAIWNDQNITPSPEIWDLIISFSPALLPAIVGIVHDVQEKPINQDKKLLLVWLAITIIILVIPFSLQRRFIFALFIPISILAIEGIAYLAHSNAKKFRFLVFILLVFSILTNVVVVFSGLNQVRSANLRLVIERDEMSAFLWINENHNEDDVVLCSPSLGNFMPAYTGRQVLYGHPFETVDADYFAAAIEDFYSNKLNLQEQNEFLSKYHVKWILLGPREKTLGTPEVLNHLEQAYQNNTVTIYRTEPGS